MNPKIYLIKHNTIAKSIDAVNKTRIELIVNHNMQKSLNLTMGTTMSSFPVLLKKV